MCVVACVSLDKRILHYRDLHAKKHIVLEYSITPSSHSFQGTTSQLQTTPTTDRIIDFFKLITFFEIKHFSTFQFSSTCDLDK